MTSRLVSRLLLAAVLCLAADLNGQEAARRLRVVGEFPARVERVRARPDGTAVLTLQVGRCPPAIQRGDTVRLHGVAPDSGTALAEVVTGTRADPASGRLHLRVRISDEAAAARLAAGAPELLPDFPQAIDDRDAFVLAHGPRATIVTPFEPQDGADPAVFLVVGKRGSSEPTGSAAKAPVDSSFTLRFSAPIALSTLQHIRLLTADGSAEVPCRVMAVDDTGTCFRLEPPLGLAFVESMREAAQKHPELPHYRLRIANAAGGLRAVDGCVLEHAFEVPIRIDPAAADNHVAWRVMR